MKNKKIMSAVLAGAMGITLLAGCGSTASTDTTSSDTTKTDDSASSDDSSSTEVQDITLTVMTPAEDQDDANGNWAKTECEAFAAAHPEYNITFNYLQTSEGDAKDVVTKDPTDTEGTAGDVYMFANDQISALVDANALAELGGDAASAVTDNNSKTIAGTVTYNGSIYGVPYTSNSWFMYYDKRVFSEDDVKNLDTMLEKGKVEFPLENAWYLAAFYAGNGCTFYGEDGTDESGTIDLTGDKATAVTKYLVGLMSNKNFKVQGDSPDITGLGNGDVNAIFDGNWDYANVVGALGEENVGCAVAPTYTLDGTEVQMKPFIGSKALGVNPNSKYQKAAVQLAVFLGSEDAQKAHFDKRGQAPVNTNLATNSDVAANPACAALAATAQDGYSIAQPLFGMDSYWDAAANFGKAIHNGEVTADNAEDKTADFNTSVNAESAAE